MSVYLSALGIACTLGRGKEEVAKALFRPCSPISDSWTLLSKNDAPVGKIPFELPELPPNMQRFDSKNNKLLAVVLDEIKPAVKAAIAKYGSTRIGVVMATSTSGMFEEEKAFKHKHQTGTEPETYHYSQTEISSPSLFAAYYLDVQGPSYTISTACSSSGKALCSARRLIMAGICDAVVVGGVDTLCNITLNGFDSLDLISTELCKPFSKNRKGITIGEGAAVFLAVRDGNFGDIELCGCGESSDAHHISCPDPEGHGAENAINEALATAGLKPEDICYINLHGTGTALNDAVESLCINRIFGEKTPCSSTKALTGHALGASGAIEAAFLWLSLSLDENRKIPIPPHVWDGERDASLPFLHLSDSNGTVAPIKGAYVLMSNSFAFGGSNVSIIIKKQVPLDYKITDLIPHDPPMVFIDRAISYRDDFIHCQLEIKKHSPFCENGSVPSYIAMEYMAQAVAAWNGLMSKRQGVNPKIGFLLGSRRLELDIPDFKVGDVLDVYGKAQYIEGGMASFECWINIKNARAAHAIINVYQPGENDEK